METPARSWSFSTPTLMQTEQERVLSTYHRQRSLMDVLEIHYTGRMNRAQVARFVFLKDRAPLVEQIAARLGAVEAV